jgi:hypothetical protein
MHIIFPDHTIASGADVAATEQVKGTFSMDNKKQNPSLSVRAQIIRFHFICNLNQT